MGIVTIDLMFFYDICEVLKRSANGWTDGWINDANEIRDR
jgi:hypothetical protein